MARKNLGNQRRVKPTEVRNGRARGRGYKALIAGLAIASNIHTGIEIGRKVGRIFLRRL